MCGIFGYIGKESPLILFLDGLARLEYRGYDSCGFAGMNKGKFFLKKMPGKVSQLKAELQGVWEDKFSNGILHTRWSTHGEPCHVNAHPHLCCRKEIALVHNGIIENYFALKEELLAQGHKFLSETDTEIIVHLIESFYQGVLEEAVYKGIKKLKGSFALGVISRREPDKMVVIRKGSPLIIGLGEQGNFLSSDMPALLPLTKKVIYLQEEQVAVLEKHKMGIFDFSGKRVKVRVEEVKMKVQEAQKKGFAHFMLKEIWEQPQVLAKTFSLYCPEGKVVFPQLKLKEKYLKQLKKVYITACGTAYHAGYLGKYLLEKYCGLDVQIDTSSEFRYRSLNLGKGDLVIAISQSGETADTLAAVKHAREQGARVLSVCNVLGSSLVKESDSLIFTLAGPEIGVASTKAYTAQVFSLYLFVLYLADLKKTLKEKDARSLLSDLGKIPAYQKQILAHEDKISEIAKLFSRVGCFLFLGRGINYPSAMEGALKLKEISYIPAEGYPAGEMKHGPIALIDEYRGVVCIVPQDNLHDKMVANMQEIKARKGKVLGLINAGDKEARHLSDEVIYMPRLTHQDLSPLLVAVCLQLLAYFVAKNLGCGIDQPRNLAKSVTVE